MPSAIGIVVTVAYMPLAVPVMVTLDRGCVDHRQATPVLVLAPRAIGMAIQRNSASFAAGLQPYVKKMTGISTINRQRERRFSAFANRAGLRANAAEEGRSEGG